MVLVGLVESETQGRISHPPPKATLMEYIFRLIEHSAENQFSFGNAQSTHPQVNKGAHLIFVFLASQDPLELMLFTDLLTD